MTEISIIVPCHNCEKYICETLDCLQKQTIENWECIIVNDGSTDNSLEILREYEHTDIRYKVIDKEHEGPSVARNAAIAASSGKYILPLDADDLIEPHYLELAIEYLESHPKCKLVYCRAEYFGNKTGEWILPDYNYDNELWGNPIFCSAVFRRSDYDKTIGYNPNMIYGNEDWDFWLSLLSREDEVYKIPQILFRYRQHGMSRTTNLLQNRKEAHIQMIMNHIDLYKPFLGELLNVKYLRSKCEKYKLDVKLLQNSTSYKIGYWLTNPFRLIRLFLRKVTNRNGK